MAMKSTNSSWREVIQSANNLTLCEPNYFEACWCQLNSTKAVQCSYLLRHVIGSSNSTYFCVYHTIRKAIECFKSSYIFSEKRYASSPYIYLTIFLFVIGLLGNGLSIVILCNRSLRRLSVYRNLIVLCSLNILYLIAIFIRHINTYGEDLRDVSTEVCRVHTFIVVFTGHLCSWQLVSTSIQRVYALLSLHSRRKTSWIRTLTILFIGLILPLFIFDGQLLFNYGLFSNRHVCDKPLTRESEQMQRALRFPIQTVALPRNVSFVYHTGFLSTTGRCSVCILWNIFDTLIYAIIPFLLVLTSSFIIIATIVRRRRATVIFGGLRHTNPRLSSTRDHLSILLIAMNCLFLIMTGPLNVCFIIESTWVYFSFHSSSLMKISFSLDESLRLLQNSYHALSFIFYCVMGNKFRESASSICRTVYCKLLRLLFGRSQTEATVTLCCLELPRLSTNGQTSFTNLSQRRSTRNQRNTRITKANLLSIEESSTIFRFRQNEREKAMCDAPRTFVPQKGTRRISAFFRIH